LKGRSLQIQQLEERQLLATDLDILGFSSDGEDLLIGYEVRDGDAVPFDIGVSRSADGVTPDAMLSTRRISEPIDLTPGIHWASISPDFTDTQSDYVLLAELDIDGEVAETSETNNTLGFEGGRFHAADGTIHVHGPAEFLRHRIRPA